MGMFNKKESTPEKTEPKPYIQNAGGSIVSKSILNGTSELKWLFRQDNKLGNGWIAFGDTDTEEYVNNAENMAIVDFNTLIDLEPAVFNVFHMPIGADLEFRSDKTGKYFIDTRSGEEIRQQVKHPAQIAFEKNLKFLNQPNYSPEFFRRLFQISEQTETFTVGEADFPTGEIVLADPLAYLGSEYVTRLDRNIPVGKHAVELSIFHSSLVGLRIAAAKLVISRKPVAQYEIAMPKGKKLEDLEKPGAWTFFGVDTGLACFTDTQVAEEYRQFMDKWQSENQGKNKYDDYFFSLFQKSREAYPDVQNEEGDFLLWELPHMDHKLVMFSSGMGDGIYSGYWGLDADNEAAELIIPFMDPAYF